MTPRPNPSMLRDYETMTMQLARAYFTRLDEGPEVLALPIELQLDLADRLLERPQRAADRRRLCAIGAQLSMLLGIATYDLGQPTPAQGWFDAAASAAARAGEPALGAEALASAAWAALGRSTRGLWEADDRQQTQADVWHAVGLLDRAETLAARDAIPWTQARLASLRAEASATLGDVAATEANSPKGSVSCASTGPYGRRRRCGRRSACRGHARSSTGPSPSSASPSRTPAMARSSTPARSAPESGRSPRPIGSRRSESTPVTCAGSCAPIWACRRRTSSTSA